MRGLLKFPLLLLPLLVGALLVLAFVLNMSRSEARYAGSNSVPTEGLVVEIGPHSRVCQAVDVPADAGSAQFFVGPLGPSGPAASMRLVDARGHLLGRGRIAGGWSGKTIRFHFPTLSKQYPQSTICLRDEGRVPIRFTGLSTGAPTSTLVDGKPELATLSIVFYRPGTSDTWSLLPTIAKREGMLKGSLSGGWSLWFAAALVLLGGIAAVVVSVRGLES
jgi:hypothetical protein